MTRRKQKRVPRFPRKKWTGGQSPRVQKPLKGKGSYRRVDSRKEVSERTHDPETRGRP